MTYLRSLWITLSLQRAFILTNYGLDPFDRLPDACKANFLFGELFENNELQEEIAKIDNNDDKAGQRSNRSSTTEEDLVDNNLIKIISKNKNNLMLNTSNLYSMLCILYEFMTSSIIRLTQNNRNQIEKDDHQKTYDEVANDKLEDFLEELIESEINNNDQFERNYFNISMFQIKHVYHVWRLFSKLYSKYRNTQIENYKS